MESLTLAQLSALKVMSISHESETECNLVISLVFVRILPML